MIKQIFKFLFAFLLLYYLFAQGKIDLSIISQSLNNKFAWALCFSFLLGTVLLTTLRWKLLLETKSSIKFNYFSILKLSWIGLMFNTALPGAVSGDIIKLVYAKNIDKSLDKTFLVTSVVLDRAFGLFGLITLLGFFSVFNYFEISSKSNELANMIHFNFFLVLGMIGFILVLFVPVKFQQPIINFASKIPVIKNHAVKTLHQFWLIGDRKLMVLGIIILSVACHVFNVLAFWSLAKPFFTTDIPTSYAFTFVPIGMVSIAIPISPAGLGIGHAVFDKLFHFFGQAGGASLFNFQFIANVVINLFGIIPYLFYSDKSKINNFDLDEKEPE